MSHSQFHSTDLFILRHAWLNLWDKHMTTGRINQVSYRDCDKLLHKSRTPTKVCVHLGHSQSLAASCVYCPSFKLTSLKRDQKQVSRLTWTIPGTRQEDAMSSLPVYWQRPSTTERISWSFFAHSVLLHQSRLLWSQRLHFQLLVLHCLTHCLTDQGLTAWQS